MNKYRDPNLGGFTSNKEWPSYHSVNHTSTRKAEQVVSKLSNFRKLNVSHKSQKRRDLLSPTHAPITYATVKQGSFCSALFIHAYSGWHVAFETAVKMFGRTANTRESENVMAKRRERMPGVMTELVIQKEDRETI